MYTQCGLRFGVLNLHLHMHATGKPPQSFVSPYFNCGDFSFENTSCYKQYSFVYWDYLLTIDNHRLNRAARNPTVLNMVLFTALTHLESNRGPIPFSGSKEKIRLEQFQYKGEALRGLLDSLRNGNKLDSDELIQTMLFLGMNEIQDEEDPPDWSPFSAPLPNLQWLEIYGIRKYHMPHVIAAEQIVKRRGGNRNIGAIGLPWCIAW
jgi:hypothetical protein